MIPPDVVYAWHEPGSRDGYIGVSGIHDAVSHPDDHSFMPVGPGPDKMPGDVPVRILMRNAGDVFEYHVGDVSNFRSGTDPVFCVQRNIVVTGTEFTVFDTETASPVDVKGIAASVDPGVLDTDVFP